MSEDSSQLHPPSTSPHHSLVPAAAYGEPRPLSAQGSVGSLDAYAASAAAASHATAAALPPSGIYAASCRAFTWPLLAPQSQVGLGWWWCGAGAGGLQFRPPSREKGVPQTRFTSQVAQPCPTPAHPYPSCPAIKLPSHGSFHLQEEPGPAYATWLLPPDEPKVELRRQHVRACMLFLPCSMALHACCLDLQHCTACRRRSMMIQTRSMASLAALTTHCLSTS